MARSGSSRALARRLLEAAKVGDAEAAKMLLARGAHAPGPGADVARLPLHVAAGIAGNWQVLSALLEGGLDPNRVAWASETALHVAAAAGNVVGMRLLLNRGACPHAAETGGHTAMHHAAEGGHAECVQLLIDSGAEVNVVTSVWHATPLHGAASSGSVDCFRILLEAGASITARTSEGVTPIETGVRTGSVELVRWLARQGLPEVSPYSPHWMFGLSCSRNMEEFARLMSRPAREEARQYFHAESDEAALLHALDAQEDAMLRLGAGLR